MNKKIMLITFLILFLLTILSQSQINTTNIIVYLIFSTTLIFFVLKSPMFKNIFSSSFFLTGLYPKLVLICALLLLIAPSTPFPAIIYSLGIFLTSIVTLILLREYKLRKENRKILLFDLIFGIAILSLHVTNFLQKIRKQ